FGGDVISSTEALSLTQVPQSLAVIGGGYIGLELGTAFARLGAKVTVVEAADRILPLYDAELTRLVETRLRALEVEVITGARLRGRTPNREDLIIDTADGERRLSAGKVLVTVGRRPVTDGFGLEEIDL